MHTHHVHHTHAHHLPLSHLGARHEPAHPFLSAVSHKFSHLAHELQVGINRAALRGISKKGKRRGGGPPWSGPPGVPWGFPPMY